MRDKLGEFRGVARELIDHSGDRPNEHAGIPGESALAEELFGEFKAGFFAEAFDFVGRIGAVEIGDVGGRATLDVTVGRAWPAGLNANGDQAVGMFSGGDRVAEDGLEGGVILNQLIGWQDHHHGVWIAGGDEADAEGDCRSGVAFGGFGEDVLFGQHGGCGPHGIQLFFVGEDEDIFEWHQAVEAADGLFEEGAVAKEVEKLFGQGVSAEWPEAGSGATGEDEGVGVLWDWHDGGHCE